MFSPQLTKLNIKLFADGANLESMIQLSHHPLIKGFTTNPTLMRQAGITDYEAFARAVLNKISHHPVSFEVFADDLETMENQARYIASWGKNVNVKIPVTNTKGVFTGPIIKRLSDAGVIVNVTAVMTMEHAQAIHSCFTSRTPGIISVFAGRIADSGVDPEPHMKKILELFSTQPQLEILWASPRELFNLVQADRVGCHIITLGHDLLNKLSTVGKNLAEFSLDTVKMFARDAEAAKFSIATEALI